MITFAYPAFNPTTSITIDAQLLGDTDIPAQSIVTLYTMDKQSITRKKTPQKRLSSSWTFKGHLDVYEIRQFFQQAQGEYIKYTHYDGTEWCLIINAKSFPVETDGLRARDVDFIKSKETSSFTLRVDRWAM